MSSSGLHQERLRPSGFFKKVVVSPHSRSKVSSNNVVIARFTSLHPHSVVIFLSVLTEFYNYTLWVLVVRKNLLKILYSHDNGYENQ